jgi:hypothetical protein
MLSESREKPLSHSMEDGVSNDLLSIGSPEFEAKDILKTARVVWGRCMKQARFTQ